MTRFIHDQFAKDYLEELLTPYGTIQSPRRVAGEVRREARREQTSLAESDYPHLWILTPTASAPLLEGFGATLEVENWGEGIYQLSAQWRSAIIVIHQLPRTRETLWLRVLGRGQVQEQAFDELEQLPPGNPFRDNALMLLNRLKANLEMTPNLNQEDRDLIMRLSPLFDQQLEAAQLSGLERGREQERREAIASLLEARFGSLDNELSQLLDPMIRRPSSELMPLLLQLSREELIERFSP